VPMRVVDRRSDHRAVGRRLDGEHPRLGGTRVLHLTVEECVEHGELQLDGGERRVDLWLPLAKGFVKLCRCRLVVGDAGVALLLHHRELGEAVGDGDLVVGEALLDLLTDLCELVDQQLGVRLHRSKFLLSTSVVLMILQGSRRIKVSDTKCYQLDSKIEEKKRLGKNVEIGDALGREPNVTEFS
jgi:hypothetical protein